MVPLWRRGHNRRHVDEKGRLFLMLKVPYDVPPVKHNLPNGLSAALSLVRVFSVYHGQDEHDDILIPNLIDNPIRPLSNAVRVEFAGELLDSGWPGISSQPVNSFYDLGEVFFWESVELLASCRRELHEIGHSTPS